MRQEEKEYYESEDSSFKMDLHYGKIKIYEVPFEYRTRNAYLYAHEYTLAVYDGSEKSIKFCNSFNCFSCLHIASFSLLFSLIALSKS